MKISSIFPVYDKYPSKVPIWCVTPARGSYIHRFFDTSPFSPSGRYLAALNLPYEDRDVQPGDQAEVVVVDLETGEQKTVATTCGWEFQLGANINWGMDDDTLYFNDVDPGNWNAFCVRLNWRTGEKRKLEGTIYRISPDGKHIISANMKTMCRTQAGYGVVVPPENIPRYKNFAEEDGLFITDTQTGKCKLLVSIAQIFEKAQPKIDAALYKEGECYGFHCKYNPQGDKIMFTMRWFPKGGCGMRMMKNGPLKYWVLTMNADGSDIRVAVGPEQWDKGGHHTNWYPDGRQLSMNLFIDGDRNLYLCKVNLDGSGLSKIIESVPGSGHPTVHPDGRHILADTYADEPTADGDGTSPLRWIDLERRTCMNAAKVDIATAAALTNSDFRIDPHPAWDATYRFVAFNGLYEGHRAVFVADFTKLIEEM